MKNTIIITAPPAELGFEEPQQGLICYDDYDLESLDKNALRRHFRPAALSDENSRKRVYEKLCSPFTVYGLEPEYETTQYEWSCLLKGDIPYYCTTAAGTHLCGEDPGQIVKKDYYQTSVLQSAERFLSRLSPEDENFEEELLRVVFDHAPTDEEPEKEPEPVFEEAVRKERLIDETAGLFRQMKKDAVRCIDGTLIWLSTAEALDMTESFGTAAMSGNTGMLASRIAVSGLFPELHEEAAILAEKMCLQIRQLLDRFEEAEPAEDGIEKVIPSGLYTGLGDVILACHEMELAGIAGACGLSERFIRLGLSLSLYRYPKLNAAQGAAGLILALSAREGTKAVTELAAAAAERLLAEDLPDRSDLSYGCAGIGAALAAAFAICRDERCRDGSLAAFRKVLEDYRPELSGWPDGNAALKWMADKGPYEAGILLAAYYAKEKLACDPKEDVTVLDQICSAALESMRKEQTILRLDSLDQGNALTVLAFLKAGDRGSAEKILSAMLKRKERKGCFTVTPAGIRSSFDASYYMGTAGLSYMAMEFLKEKEE